MIKFLIGSILLISPFLLINKFKNKRLGFACILSFVISFHLFIAVITQLFGIFSYTTILLINFAVFLAVLAKVNPKKVFSINNLAIKNIDCVLIFIAIISILNLSRVHYSYSGIITTSASSEYQDTNHMVYPYPYVSDEWYAISLIKYSINSKSLPIKNPLTLNKISFVNLELPFHATISEVILLLDLDPLNDYTKVSIITGTLIIILVYLFLRQNKIDKLTAGIISLSALYITHGANLQTLWVLFPFTIGLIALLAHLIFLSTKNIKLVLFTAFISLVFYPPLFPLLAITLSTYLITSKEFDRKEKINTLAIFVLLAALAALIISTFYIFTKGLSVNLVSYIFSKIFYSSFTKNALPRYAIYNIVPLHIILLSIIGFFEIRKKQKWLTAILVTGIAYWILYSLITLRIIIEYQRVVYVTSILITITAGFGLTSLLDKLKTLEIFQNNSLKYLKIGILVLFLLLVPKYTNRSKWKKLILVKKADEQIMLPGAPANKHLHFDDLRIFKEINGKRFLSVPWKGTVIAIATDNYPMVTKTGTISLKRQNFYEFMTAGCTKKKEIAEDKSIEYFYLPEFNCPNFKFIEKSSEGFSLYKFTGS